MPKKFQMLENLFMLSPQISSVIDLIGILAGSSLQLEKTFYHRFLFRIKINNTIKDLKFLVVKRTFISLLVFLKIHIHRYVHTLQSNFHFKISHFA